MSKPINDYAELLVLERQSDWSREFYRIVRGLGFNSALIALIPRLGAPFEDAFVESNYSPVWRTKYCAQKLAYIDPTVAHCTAHSAPLIWHSELFSSDRQRLMYEEACGYGLQSGVVLPFHGPRGEAGMLSVATDLVSTRNLRSELSRLCAPLSLLRDVAFESVHVLSQATRKQAFPPLTQRELECLKWTAAGKTSWEISAILRCSEAAVNFHIANLRRKLGVGTRREAVVRALKIGLIDLD